MLNRVNLNFIWQFQLGGPRGDNFDVLVWTYSTVVPLTAWATSDNVLRVEPYLIPFLERWGWSSSSVRTLAVTVLGTEDLSLEVFMDLL
jgi:hypothetical protein